MSARVAVLCWDWKEQPDMDTLALLLRDLSGGTIHLHEVNTESDEFAIVLATTPLTAEQVDAAWTDIESGEVSDVR